MPVIGLNGFMLGPSKPVINTRNVNPLPELPLKMQLYLGKYPETKCTVKTYKPSMKLADLLYDPNQFPSWMSGAHGEAVLSSFPSSSEISDSGSFSSIESSTTTKSSEPSKSVVIRSGNKSSKTRLSISSRNLRQPNSSTSRISQDSPYSVLSSQGSPASPQIEQRINRRVKAVPRMSGGSLLVTVRKTMCTSLSAPSRVSSSPFSTRYGVPADSNPGTSKRTRKYPLLRTTKSSRIPRRERNRVREEAEKAAYLRAYKFQKPCTSQSEARNSAVSESSDSRQLGGDKMEHFSNLSLGVTGFAKGRNSWRRMIMPSLKISSDSTTINQLALGKVKDGIIRSPSLGKAFQLH
ncbi:hypothetical protein M758_3G211300 [Ceratodon purpureus]|nr:hypothetical protein M758_3G211300 [Ceratodon purpureus]